MHMVTLDHSTIVKTITLLSLGSTTTIINFVILTLSLSSATNEMYTTKKVI